MSKSIGRHRFWFQKSKDEEQKLNPNRETK